MNNPIELNLKQPKYAIVENLFRDKIIRGEIKPGERLPAEAAISKSLNTSLITVRKAFSSLVKAGLIKRTPGKGTFVSEASAPQREVEVISDIGDFLRVARTSKVRILDKKLIDPPDRVAEIMGIVTHEKVYFLEIIRTLKDQPFLYAIEYILKGVGEKIIHLDLENNTIFDLLKYVGFPVCKVVETIEAKLSDAKLCNLLKLPIGSPVFFAQRTYYCEGLGPIFVLEGSYRGDVYKYKILYERDRLSLSASKSVVSSNSDRAAKYTE